MELLTRFETITPNIASVYLARNTHNRKKKEKKIKEWAAVMKAGGWRLNGETIKFYEDGTLADGQNRLEAVIRSGVPVEMEVRYGIPNDVTTFDIGSNRNMHDILVLSGYKQKNLNITIKALRMMLFLVSIQNASPDTIGDLIDTYAKAVDSASRAFPSTNAHKSGEFSIARNVCCYAANLCLLMAGEDERIVKEFWDIVRSGFCCDESKTSAIVFRNYMISEYRKTIGDASRKTATFATALMAYNDFKNGVARTKRYKVVFPLSDNSKVEQWEYVKSVCLRPYIEQYNGK